MKALRRWKAKKQYRENVQLEVRKASIAEDTYREDRQQLQQEVLEDVSMSLPKAEALDEWQALINRVKG